MQLPTFTLLIVEDLAIQRELYRQTLDLDSSCVYHLLEAESAAAGLELCRSSRIDAILLDYALPDGDGLAFLATLDTQSNGCSPPVVMVTGMGDQRIAVNAMKLGAADYIVKRDLTPALLQSSMRDAIENTRLRLQLQQSKDRLQISINTMIDCYGTYAAIRDDLGQIIDFRFDYLNAAALENTRMTTADMGRGLCELFPAVRATGLFEKYCQVVATGEPLVLEELVYTDEFGAQQLTRVYDIRINKLDDGFVAVWRDVTVRKQAELILKANNQQNKTMAESMTDAYFTLDLDWQISYSNPQAIEIFRQVFGLAPGEFLGKSYWEVFPWTIGQIVEQEYRRAVTDRVAVHFEVWDEPTGNWFEIHAYPSEIGLGIYVRDIHQRKRQDVALVKTEREQEQERFFTLSLDLLAIANFEGYMLSLNPAWEKVLGFTAAELMAQPYLDLVHPDDLAATLAATQALSQGETAIRFENRYRCKDGSYRWLSWNSRPYDDQNLVYAVAYDITEAKQTASILQAYQATIQQQLGEIEAIYKMAPIGLCFMDTDLRFVRINEQLAEINGSSVAAHLGQTLREAVPEMADQLEPLHQQVIDSGEPILNLELSGMTAAQPGVLQHWLVCYHPQKDADDRVVGVNVMVKDITDRKHQEAKHQQAEAALFQRESQLQLFVKHVPVGVAMFDHQMNYLSASDRWIASYRLPDRDIIGRSHYDISPDQSQRWEAIYQGCLAGAVASCEEDPFILTDGSIKWIRWEIYPWYANIDEIGGIMIFSEVITDRKQTQTNLEQRNQALDSFTYVVSHDLKAPLRAIANLSEWIEEDLEGALSIANQEQMALLRSRVFKMGAMIDGLLEYARCDRSAETIESVSIAELLADVIDLIAPPPTFMIELPPELPTLSTKRLPLCQVLVNLVGNGIKHHDRVDGTIQISCQDRGECYEFAISDDGPGIAPEHHDRMFEIFQAVNPQKRSDSTGIGLAIVKKIVEAEGGKIWLESQLGQGTTFYFTWLK